MHIIGGHARGTKLTTLAGNSIRPTGTRPTLGRNREAMFNLVMGGRFSPPLLGAVIIDLFAGTGAIGLEALSRGAAKAAFIEINMPACHVIQQNIKKLRMEAKSRLYPTGFAALSKWAGTPADIVFSDAPYGEESLTAQALVHMTKIGAIKSGALIIAETHKNEQLSLPDAFQIQDRRIYGIAAITILNWNE